MVLPRSEPERLQLFRRDLILYSLPFAQRPTLAHDHHTARSTSQKHSERHWRFIRSRRFVHVHHNHARRICCPLRCRLPTVHHIVCLQQLCWVYLHPTARRASGSYHLYPPPTYYHLGTSSNGGGQVIAPFLIILRVANGGALTSNAVTSGNLGSLRFDSGGGSTGETSDQFGVGSQDS